MISKTVFIAVFLLVTITATVVTFILPEYYAGIVRVRTNGDPIAAIASIQSDPVLKSTIDKLNLTVEWGKRYNNGAPIKIDDCVLVLKRCLAIRLEHEGALIDLTVYREDRDEAARIANAIAEAYQAQSTNKVEIVEQAKPAFAPARPNKPLNIAFGVVAGLVLGAGVGWLAALLNRNRG